VRGIGVGAGSVIAGVIVGVLVVACRANPVFAVDDDDPPATSAAASSTDGTTRPEQTGLASTDTTDSGPDATTANVSASETSTGAPDTGDTTTGAPDTDSSTTADTDSTTGDVEQEIYDLHDRCDLMPDTIWLAENAGAITGLECYTGKDPPPPPWAGYLFDFTFADQLEPRVVHMMPEQYAGAIVTGEFNGLQFANAVAPHLRAVLVCPEGADLCSIIGSVRVEDLNNKPIVGQEEIPLGPGQMQFIDLDLTEHIDVLSKQPFRVVLAVTAQSGSGGDRGVWVRPRIVDLN
jgi:hypothetical protein